MDFQNIPITSHFDREDDEYLVLSPLRPEKTAIHEILIPKTVILAITRTHDLRVRN